MIDSNFTVREDVLHAVRKSPFGEMAKLLSSRMSLGWSHRSRTVHAWDYEIRLYCMDAVCNSYLHDKCR
jgi:hypothetical protein